jgi:hypothetical protein
MAGFAAHGLGGMLELWGRLWGIALFSSTAT